MGVDFSATLAVGVKLGTVWSVRTVSEKVKKFNPDTGEPYEATKSKKVGYFCGQPTDWGDLHHDDLECKADLDIVYDHYEGDRNDWVLGKTLCTASNRDDDAIVEVKPEAVEAAKKEVAAKLEKFGYRGEIGVFLISYVSY